MLKVISLVSRSDLGIDVNSKTVSSIERWLYSRQHLDSKQTRSQD